MLADHRASGLPQGNKDKGGRGQARWIASEKGGGDDNDDDDDDDDLNDMCDEDKVELHLLECMHDLVSGLGDYECVAKHMAQQRPLTEGMVLAMIDDCSGGATARGKKP